MFRVALSIVFLVVFSLQCMSAALAGSLAGPISVLVSGRPASEETILAGIKAELSKNVSLEPGAELNIDFSKLSRINALALGDRAILKVPYSINGNGYSQVKSLVEVRITNQQYSPAIIDRLFISNNPEEIDFPGVLFHEVIKKQEMVRYLYYHKTKTRKLNVSGILTNKGNFSGTIWLTVSSGGPDSDSIFAGHLAVKRAYEKMLAKEGFFVTLAPGESIEIFRQTVKSGQTVSGFLELNSFDVDLDLKMVAIGNGFGSESGFLQHDKDENVIRGGVFNSPYLEFDVNFSKYQKERRLRLGDTPEFKDIYTGEILKGNYGVSYTYNIWLDNRSNANIRILDLVMIPGGGVARGIFQIYDRLSETKLLKSRKEEALIKRVELYPNEIRKVVVQTIPEPGSFYPVNLIIRELE